jgi:hypothetical protein
MSSEITENDHKILADLAYLDLQDELLELYDEGEMTIGRLAEFYYGTPDQLKGLEGRFRTEAEFQQYVATIESLSNPSSKFYDWKIADYTNNNHETGFVAYTFEPNDREAVIAIRGSEPLTEPAHLNTDWKNNGSTLYKDLSVQQDEARNYFNEIGEHYDSISAAGHSLGGNDTLAGGLLADEAVRDKIWALRTFNAPGFNKEFLVTYQDNISEMKSRIQEFQNEDDVVSSIMYNPTEPIIIVTSMMVTEGMKRVFDPFVFLQDSHALKHMPSDAEGNLIRKEYQIKNFSNHFVANLTKGTQMLPNPLLGGFVEAVFALVNGRVNLDNYVKAGLLLTVIAPLPTLAAGLVTIKTIVTAVAAVLLVTLAVTAVEVAAMAVEQFTRKVYEKVNNYLNELFARMVVGALAAAIKIAEFKEMLKQEVNAFLAKVAEGFVKWWKSVSGGDRGVIEVNTGHLQSVAARLANVQQRINRVDDRLNSLRRMAALDDKLSVAFLDFRVGYDHDLKNIINYLHFTANKLEESERRLSWKAREI